MAIRTLLLALQAATEQGNEQLRADRVAQVRNETQAAAPFLLTAEVIAVDSLTGATVLLNGSKQITCTAATDEPLQAGMQVYISQIEGGNWVIHGSVKG
jgi:hypothetical protein